MMHFQKQISKTLANQTVFNFAGKQKPPTAKNLDHYDAIFIGANMGALASNHFERATKEKYKCFLSFENTVNQIYPLRGVYEMQKMKKTDYLPSSKLAVYKNTAFSDLVGVERINAEQSKVVLKNGREIGYSQLVIGSGRDQDLGAIKGFEQAWEHEEHPVYAPSDHPNWKGNLFKSPRYIYNFNSGDAYYCIPKFPFSGELEVYNFFITHEVWTRFKEHGKQHPHAKLTIINANDKFVQYNDQADQFIKEQLKSRGIEVIYNQNLTEVDQANQKMTTKDLKTGKDVVRDYNNLYSIIPTKPQSLITSSGLGDANGLLDVHRDTLQHKKHKNIFGIGDCINVPTTPSFWGGWQQIHVVRNNVERALNGQSLNALYDGYSKSPIYLGQGSMTFSEHLYDQKATGSHLKHGDNFIGSIKTNLWARQQKSFIGIYQGKTWGPPYHKFKKTFKELEGESTSTESNIQATKKTA